MRIQLLLAKDETNVNGVGTEGWSPLLLACYYGFTSVVELLLRADGIININQALTKNGCTPLFVACEKGHTPIVELLLASSDIAVNQAKTMDGFHSPLSGVPKQTHICCRASPCLERYCCQSNNDRQWMHYLLLSFSLPQVRSPSTKQGQTMSSLHGVLKRTCGGRRPSPSPAAQH